MSQRPAGCSYLEPLPALNAYLAQRLGKGKFLNATEEILAADLRLCSADSRLLDIGAGAGEYTRWLSQRCGLCAKAYDVVANASNTYSLLRGRSAKMRALARNHSASMRVAWFDGAHIPEADGSFDLVVFNSVLHHAAGQVCRLLSEAARVTTRSAIVFEDLAVASSLAVAHRHTAHDRHGIFRGEREWRTLFDGAGFATVASGRVGSRGLSRLHTGVGRLDYLYQRWFLLRRRPSLPEPAAQEVYMHTCARLSLHHAHLRAHS